MDPARRSLWERVLDPSAHPPLLALQGRSLRDIFAAKIAPYRFVVVRSGREGYQETGWIKKMAA